MACSCSGEGCGVSLGGSVGANAGTEPSRTSRSSPAGVLSTSTRGRVAVHAEGVRDPHRYHGRRARHEFEPLLAGLHRQASLQHDVTLVLRMRMKWWRCVARKEEFDQRETPVARFAGAP
jgi:hypothetical protein